MEKYGQGAEHWPCNQKTEPLNPTTNFPADEGIISECSKAEDSIEGHGYLDFSRDGMWNNNKKKYKY